MITTTTHAVSSTSSFVHNSEIPSQSSCAVDAKVYQLNPLHVAVLERNESKLVDLLERKVCGVNEGDIHGCTPLHHAAATQQVGLMALLKQHGAKENLLNDRNGTPQDLLRLTRLPKPESSDPVLIWDQDLKQPQFKSGVEVAKAIGSTFAREVYTPYEVFKADWSSLEQPCEPPEIKPFNDKMRQDYEKFCQNPPELYLSNRHVDDLGNALPDIGYGVFANRDIQPGEIVCEYIGEDTSENPAEYSDYVLNHIDGETKNRIVGFGSLVQTSFPNAITTEIQNVRGRKERTILVATEVIKRHQPITIDYGSGHQIYAKNVYELRPDALAGFFNDHQISTMIADIRTKMGPRMAKATTNAHIAKANLEELQASDHMTKMLYVAANIVALSSLFFNKIINLADVEALAEFCPNSILAINQEIILPGFRIYSESPPVRQMALRDAIQTRIAKGSAEDCMTLIGRIPEMKQKGIL